MTREDLAGCHTVEASHYTGDGFFGYTHRCVEHPRLVRNDKYLKKTRGVESVWLVDGNACVDLDAALAALDVPPVITACEEYILNVVVSDQWEDLRPNAVGPETFAVICALRDKGLVEAKAGRVRRVSP